MTDEASKLIIDEDWKSQVQREKETLAAQTATPAASEAASPTAGATSAPTAGDSQSAAPQRGPLPPASLTILITSLIAQASMVLEESLKQEGEVRTQYLEEGRHIIDLLGVLEEKTKGNCTDEETKLLTQALYEMRMAFVAVRDNPERFKQPQS
jgi:hypothetical protein